MVSCSSEHQRYNGEGKIVWNDVPLTTRKGFKITFPKEKVDRYRNSRTFSTKDIPTIRSLFHTFPYELYIQTNREVKDIDLLNTKCSVILNKDTEDEKVIFNEKIVDMNCTISKFGFWYYARGKSFLSLPKNFLKSVTVSFSIPQENIGFSYNLVIGCANGL